MEKKEFVLTPERAALEDKINNHEIFQIEDGAERLRDKTKYLDLANLMLEYLNVKDWMNKRLQKEGEWVDYDDSKFNDEAFMLTYRDTVKAYSSDSKVPYLAYFNTAYGKTKNKPNVTEMSVSMGMRYALPREKYGILKSIEQFAADNFINIEFINSEVIREISEALQRPEKEIVKLLKMRRDAKSVPLDQRAADDPDGETLAEKVKNDEDLMVEHLEMEELIGTFDDIIRGLLDYDIQEWPRLFFTNDMLKELKDKSDPRSDKMRDIMRSHEEQLLWDMFDKGYVFYTLQEPPVPDTIDNMYEAKAIYEFIDATIARYKDVSRSAVKQRRDKYKKQQLEWQAAIKLN